MQHLHLPWAAPHRPTPQTTQRNHHFAVVTQRSPQLHHLQQRGSCLPARASRREPKDPSSFRDMDEARAYLHSTANGGSVGPISGALNWLSNAAFGAGRAGAHIGAWYRHWLSQSQHSSSSSSQGSTAAAAAAAALPAAEDIASLALVMLVSEHRVQKLALSYPQVLTMPPADVAARLVLLKDLFPGSDVARMVELAPGLLLGASEAELHAAQARVAVLTQHLPGADIAFMVQEDPSVAFEDLEPSLPRLFELWPVDSSALAASDPKHLALALRALSDKGPPKRF